jgi:hypothetical protein
VERRALLVGTAPGALVPAAAGQGTLSTINRHSDEIVQSAIFDE